MAGAGSRDAAARPRTRAFRALGTEVAIHLWPAPGTEARAEAALARAEVFLRRAEARLSRFEPDSEIGRLNRAGGRAVRVSRLTATVIEAALEAAHSTGGLFDPTVHAALVAAGYDRDFQQIGEQTGEGGAPGPAVPGGYRLVEFDRRSRSVRLPAGVGLDLGGIAKGWLADALVRRLRRLGKVLADLGGDLACTLPPEDEATWEVGIADPWDDGQTLGWLEVGQGGVATSGVARRRWRTAAGWQHHLIDPRTGAPAASDLLAATVVAPTATAAEVAAKSALLLGGSAGARALAASPHLAGVLVTVRGEIITVGEVAWAPARTMEVARP